MTTTNPGAKLAIAILATLTLAACDTPETESTNAAITADGGVSANVSAVTSTVDYCYLPSEGRGAGTVPSECPAGTVRDGELCYPTCAAGYSGVGPVCWGSCPAGTTDDGATCRRDAHVVSKPSYGRGGGWTPNACPGGQQMDGGLCYPNCAGGYYGVGPVCWQSCRAGYADHGATCFRNIFDFYWKGSYGRGGGATPSQCSNGQLDAGLCYSWCASGYSGSGPVCWGSCPAGYANDGATCRRDVQITAKPSYGRGAGVGRVCSASLEYDAGLCYGLCDPGYDGIGPVCWGVCPAGMVACGAGCASSQAVCADTIITQVTSSLAVAGNIAAAITTFGGSTAVTGAARIALSQAERTALREAARRELQGEIQDALLDTAVDALIDAAEDGQISASTFDPTGIAALVEAFDFPVCGAN